MVNRSNVIRVPDVSERELMLGFPLHYTAPCAGKSDRKTSWYNDMRLSLLGNTWSVPVVAWFLGQLLGTLGLVDRPTPQDIVAARGSFRYPGAFGPAATQSCER